MKKKQIFIGTKRQHFRSIWVLLVMLLFVLGSVQVYASEFPDKIKLNKTSVSDYYGKSFALKAKIYPVDAVDKNITWTSSNEKIASVSNKGKVKFTGIGSATITATTANGKTAVCKVKSHMYKVSKDKKFVKVGSASGKTRRYPLYAQNNYGKYDLYYPYYGCVTTAVAIIESSFGKAYTPLDIHGGKSNKPYSERHAIKKLGGTLSLWGKAAISVKTATQIFKDTGLKTKTRYKFNRSEAEKEIRNHLKAGKPVLIKANNKTHNGIRIANGHHGIVLVGIDSKDCITFIDTTTGKINYAHSSNNYAKSMKLRTLLKYHMDPASGNIDFPYAISNSSAGGYILVG